MLAACGDSGSDSDFEDPSGTDEICEDDFCDSESSDSNGNGNDKNGAGSSDSNSASSSSFKKKEADLSASSYKDSSLVGTEYNSDLGTLNILKGTMYDSTFNREYKTVQIGPYTWIAENLEYSTTPFEDSDFKMCYDKSDANCKSDGLLIKHYYANSMCPTGFWFPSDADYRYLASATKDITDPSFGFNPQFAGTCLKEDYSNKVNCSEKGQKGYYMTQDDSVFVIDASGKTGMIKGEYYGYFSLRCMKMSSFVETEKQLPICNSQTEDDLDDMFVASEGVNYYCSGNKWVKASGKKCYNYGEKHYYGDKLYVCNGSWELATMEETGAECSENNEGEIRELNGVKYICNDSTWREPNATEKSIGLCTAKNVGAIDTIPVGASLDYYYCDSTGWRTARLVDYVGKCDSSKFYNVVEFGETKYACRTDNTWEKFTTLETKVGLCTPKKIGIIDSVKQGESYDPYFCDSTGWRAAKLADYAGKCDDSNFYSTINFGTVSYACRTDGSWTKLSSTESEIGVCSPKNLGAIDTINSIIYYCDTTGWRFASISDFYECTSAKVNSTEEFKGKTFGCSEDLKWVQMDDVSKALGFCTQKKYGSIEKYNSTNYICDNGWRKATQNDLIGLCNDSTEGTITTYNGEKYGCANKYWRTLSNYENKYGLCIKKRAGTAYYVGTYMYICNGSNWKSISIKDSLGDCTFDNDYTYTKRIYSFAGSAYYCDGFEWEKANAQMVLGNCTSTRKNETGLVGDTTYVCNGVTGWVKYAGPEEEYGLCTNNTERITFNGEKYGCVGDTGSFEWRRENDLDRELGFCNGSTTMQWKELNGVDYVCSIFHHEWFTGTFSEMYRDCVGYNKYYNYGATVGFKGKTYYCQEYGANLNERRNLWHELSTMELEVGVCTPDRLNETITRDSHGSGNIYKYVCQLVNHLDTKCYEWYYIQ